MHHHAPGSLLVASALLAVSCGRIDTPVSPTQPALVGVGSSTSFSAVSSTTVAQIVNHPVCPSVAPFRAPVGVIVQVDGGVNVFVTEIRLQFTDTSGVRAPQITLPAPMLTTQFGTALVEARSARTFPLTVEIGCGTGRVGTVVVVVETRDDRGRRGSGHVSVAVS